jgi:hypothetical protein
LLILSIILIKLSEREGKDWKTVARGLGIGDEGGLYALADDGNPAWEDIEYDSEEDAEYEAMWKRDEQVNNERPINASSAEVGSAAGLAYAKRTEVR